MRRIETLEEGRAHGRVREIYHEIEEAFHIPYVSSVFRALGWHPEFLDEVWKQLKPDVETQAFVDLSGEIRQRMDALAQVTFGFADFYGWLYDHNFSREDVRSILYSIETLRYINPKMLLVTAAMVASVMGIHDDRIKRREASAVSEEEPEFPTRIPTVMPEQASNEVREYYYDIAEVLGVPIIPDDFLALGHWPAFLKKVWSELKPAMRSSTFLDEARELTAFAIEAAQELPYPISLSAPNDEVLKILEVSVSIYARVGVGTAAVRWMLVEGERTARAIGRAAGERPADG